MPAHSWATPTQLEFLNNRRVEFGNAQLEKKLPAFWVNVYRDFFAQWPTPASEIVDDDEDRSRKKKGKKTHSKPSPSEIENVTLEAWVEKRKTVGFVFENNWTTDSEITYRASITGLTITACIKGNAPERSTESRLR
jgi:hypothetical protein